MNKTKKGKIIVVTALAIATGISISYSLIGTNLHREIIVYVCTTDKNYYTPAPVRNIIQSGPEFIIINPEQSWGRNSFLVSKELADTPTNWRYLGLETVKSTWAGFALEPKSTKKEPVTQNVSFNTYTRKLKVIYNAHSSGRKADDINVTCENKNDIKKVKEAANNVSVSYLKYRNSGIGFLRPSLTNKAFNRRIYKDISQKDHSEYGRYQLLKFLGNAQRDSDEESIFNNLKQTLINKNTLNATTWEYTKGRYWWEYANEKDEAKKNATNWCTNQEYGSKDTYLDQGYKIISSNSDMKSTYGWRKQTYADGRFSGYVKYKAECDGKTYTLKKEGSVDDRSENTYGGV